MNVVRLFAVAAALIPMSAVPVAAQGRMEGHAVAALGAVRSEAIIGGAVGAEGLPRPWFGVGGELGALASLDGGVLLAFSLDGRVHFTRAKRSSSVVPFAGGGYTRLVPVIERSVNAYHWSGGVDVPWGDRRAVRVEVRQLIRQSTVFMARVGVVFR